MVELVLLAAATAARTQPILQLLAQLILVAVAVLAAVEALQEKRAGLDSLF
jgi:ABC-type nickel/cobalt efflux system permease component RcnA